jgi:hypothetical protein
MEGVVRSKDHPIIMLNPGDSSVKTPDGKFAFVGRVYGTKSINEDPAKVQELLSLFPRLDASDLLKANDGIYCWLLYSIEGSDAVKFVCTEVVSPFEIGTRHQSLAFNNRLGVDKIYGGGELIKTGLSIRFNLLSGTYSRPKLRYNFNKSKTKALIDGFKAFFPEAVYDNSMDSYINKVQTVSNELLEVYKKYGYTVRLFDTNNDFAKFSNTFWNLDFRIQYYKEKMDEASEADKPLMRTLYMEALEAMIKLLEDKPATAPAPSTAPVGGFIKRKAKKTRRAKRRL